MSALEWLDANAGWQKLISDSSGLKQFISSYPKNRGLEVMPGFKSDSKEALAFNGALATLLSRDEWMGKVDPLTGLSEDWLTDDGPRLWSTPGYEKSPRAIPQESNAEFRRELGLPDTWRSPQDVKLFDELFVTLFGAARPASMYIRPEALTMYPEFAREMEVKKGLLSHAIRVVLAGSTTTPMMMMKAGLFPVYVAVKRLQPDKPGKVRQVWTGYQYEDASEATPFANHIAMRVRLAYGMSGSVSYVLTLVQSQIRSYYLNEFEFTYKHREPEHQSAKINRFKAMAGVDVTNFDFTPGDFLLERFVENHREFGIYSDSLTDLLKWSLGGPSISGSPWPEADAEPYPSGADPFLLDSYHFRRGLPSGHPLNPDIGKFLMTFDLLSRYMLSGGEVLGKVALILKGLDPRFGLLNSTDDNLLLGDSLERLVSIIEQPGYFKLDRETRPTFLGVIYGGRPGRIIGYPNLSSFAIRWFCCEAGIGHKLGDKRAFINLAWNSRKIYYAKHPSFTDLYPEMDALSQQYFKSSLDGLILRHRDPVLMTPVTSYIDQRYLEKPDRIYYEFTADQVSPELLGSKDAFVPPEIAWPMCKLLFGSKILLEGGHHDRPTQR